METVVCEWLDWSGWFVVAGLLVAIEIFSGTLYLLMLALGVAAGGLAALAGASFTLQLAVSGVVSLVATLLLRKSRLVSGHGKQPADTSLDVGNTLTVDEWKPTPWGTCGARASYRGTWWDVELEQKDAPPEPGIFVIQDIRANRLIVRKQ
ncbi:MAG: NfeD family protein [Burkholderiaceae bacterium]|nr:NfeD family protein [Burkholderiaceae bacterium]